MVKDTRLSCGRVRPFLLARNLPQMKTHERSDNSHSVDMEGTRNNFLSVVKAVSHPETRQA